MDVTKCEAFLAAIDHGSLTAAGVFLGYTQSGITRMINALEEEVGFPLFIRTKKGVSPTENGKAMIPAFREIVRAHNHALEIGADIRGILSGALTIGSYYSVSAMWLPPILKRFRQLYPNVRINMKEGGNREMKRWPWTAAFLPSLLQKQSATGFRFARTSFWPGFPRIIPGQGRHHFRCVPWKMNRLS